MNEKLDIYDILSSLILGVLAICWIPICFPALLAIKSPKFPDAFAVIALSALAMFVGQLIQAIASLLEPLLYATFGGRPSEQAFKRGLGDRYMSAKTAARIKAKLKAAIGEEADNQSLFFYAIQKSEAAGIGRAARFNGLYAYHRGLFVLAVLLTAVLLASARFGAAATWSGGQVGTAVATAILLLALFWNRTKQRAFYYVREVLFTAERVLDEKLVTTNKPAETPPAKG